MVTAFSDDDCALSDVDDDLSTTTLARQAATSTGLTTAATNTGHTAIATHTVTGTRQAAKRGGDRQEQPQAKRATGVDEMLLKI